jgi:hypothetical protein
MENPPGDFNLEPHQLTIGEVHRHLAAGALYEPGVSAEIKAAGPA